MFTQKEDEKKQEEKKETETTKTETTEKKDSPENAEKNHKSSNPRFSRKNEDKKVNADKQKDKINELEKQIAELKEKVAGEKDDYVRLMAEFETFRRRSAEERLSLVNSASLDTIKGLLPTLDDCERAMDLLKDAKDSSSAKEGTELIYNKLFAYLKTKGLEIIKAKGEKFDTDFHEAVTNFPVNEPEKKGTVIDVIQTGYTLNGKVIRYAKVVVGA
ncbi:MAG: nucleotide exchange factor GrpE [Bacteroidales bacterium]|jgi:molecular chaperone GrpE|nr:nucleotide exchange factor GrpE [Bacteroidales bacterium]